VEIHHLLQFLFLQRIDHVIEIILTRYSCQRLVDEAESLALDVRVSDGGL
jgi:hypothetical protein